MKQMKIKQEKGEHKAEFKGENKHYTQVGETAGMHGKSMGGHPDIRAQEMGKGGKGEGHHVKEMNYKNDCNG